MRISTTERQTLKRCRRKWDLQSYNRQALTPIVNSAALDFGTIWHATLAQWTSAPQDDPLLLYSDIVAAHLTKIKENYIARIGCMPSREELMPVLEAISVGESMLTRYQQKWGSPLPPGFTLIENELTLIQDIPNTQHCECDIRARCSWGCEACHFIGTYSTQDWCSCIARQLNCECVKCHQLECTFDGVMADANGDLFIIERKTFSRTPNLDELNANDQFLAYMWALSKRLPNKVSGLAYDGALKNIKKPVDEAFLRRILLRSQDELQSFETSLQYEVQDAAILNALPYNHPHLYPTVPPVMGCMRWECSHIDVCHAMNKQNHTQVAELLKMFVKSTYKKHLDDNVEAVV